MKPKPTQLRPSSPPPPIPTKKICYPICPLNIYWEGDEDKYDPTKCDFKDRSCSNSCTIGRKF